ncbi:AAA family ATPase [Flavobacterium sp.]|uniref:AAA family ATPase n=1 Tax=Flavobacterium sp. TaxID=239 RepID=UPI002CA595BF|nr:AAA family ATPase [Flavobacterium sp.]HSD06509.1 AAA family ATPase [Flavobacterium sp.]
MADPICRWRNPYFKTIRELIETLPKENLPSIRGREITNQNWGEEFFGTPYQLACQLGLYYEFNNEFITKFHHAPTPNELHGYLRNWITKYYVPNPYTKKGFENIKPKIIHVEFAKKLKANNAEMDWNQVKNELFEEPIGNDDILVNSINQYSEIFEVKNNKLKLKDGIKYDDLDNYIYEYNLGDRNDKKAFFDFLSLDINNDSLKIIQGNTNAIDVDFELISSEDIISQFTKWLNAKPKNNYFDNNYSKTVSFLNRLQEKYIETFGVSPFDVDFKELDGFITKLNENIWNEKTPFWSYSLATSTHLPRAILNKDNYQSFLRDFKKNQDQKIQSKNIIYYGAPGTGKSHKVDKEIEQLESKYYERVTFHPEFDNASFIGGYKPKSVKVRYEDETGEYFENEVRYEFVAQSFTSIYERAWQDLDHQYYLVIEEINRGNCAEIFGEIFQLLDRTSKYTVSPSTELREYLEDSFKDKNHLGIANGLKLPHNLNILATMNTSDQSLFPMDSAFKRRWDWEYIPICYTPNVDYEKKNDSYDFEIDIEDGKKYRWIKFIEKINLNHIKNNPSLGMDKCIGNYFIKPDNENTISLKPFINKVIFYLWNDVFKDENNKVFEENTSYEDFFPININGKKKIKELFDRIELLPIKTLEIVEDDSQLEQVAEDQEEFES